MWPRLVLMIAVAFAGSGVVPPPAPQGPSLQAWLDAVNQHAPGAWDASAITVWSWSSTDLEDVFETMRMQIEESGDKRPPMNRTLLAAAVLHADIAMLAAEPRRTADSGLLMTLARDGRVYGNQAVRYDWGFARRLIDAVLPDESSDRAVMLWYRAMAAYMACNEQLSDSVPHLDRARRLFPRDAWVQFDTGAMYETFASPRIQAVVASMGPPANARAAGATTRLAVPSVREGLRMAQESYARALALDPEFVEARVRLGRVLWMRGRQKEAIPELRKALGASRDPIVNYDAALALGGACESIDDFSCANDAYSRAARMYPLAQSPHLALSRLATRRGDVPAAQREMEQVLRLSPDAPDRGDPWWTYQQGSGRRVHALLASMHAAVRAVQQP